MNETRNRLGIFALVLAIGIILIRASAIQPKTDFMCDMRTNNCYERLAMPLEKFK